LSTTQIAYQNVTNSEIVAALWPIYIYDFDATWLNCRRLSPTVGDSWVESCRRRRCKLAIKNNKCCPI